MYNKEKSGLDEHRLQQYNDLKPVTKRVLGMTLRVAGKMMKWILTTAFRIPGMVKRMAASNPAPNPPTIHHRATRSTPTAQK
jgi:hypothetical protein